MAPSGKSRLNGWRYQADRLVAAHAALGTTAMAVAEQARQRRLATEEAADADLNATAERAEVELELALAKIAGLQRRIAHESATTQAQGEQLLILAARSEAAEQLVVELQGELASERDRRDLHDDSLRTSLDLALSENARLSQSAAESNATRDEARARCEYLGSALAAAEAERSKLAGELREVIEKCCIESGALTASLEATSSRAFTAENLLADARERLLACITENSIAERKLADGTAAWNETVKGLKQLEDSLRLKQRKIDELELSRLQQIETTNKVLQSLQGRDAALMRAEARIEFLNGRIAQLEAGGSAAAIREQSPQHPSEVRGVAGGDDARQRIRDNWAELARELGKLVKYQRRFSEQTSPTSSSALLAGTIAF